MSAAQRPPRARPGASSPIVKLTAEVEPIRTGDAPPPAPVDERVSTPAREHADTPEHQHADTQERQHADPAPGETEGTQERQHAGTSARQHASKPARQRASTPQDQGGQEEPWVNFSTYLPASVRRELRARCALLDLEVRQAVTDAIKAWLAYNQPK